jgi:hypothetical protein
MLGYHPAMLKKLMFLLSFAAGCTYTPTYDVTCDEEGAVEAGRRCQGGVWVSADAGSRIDGGVDCDETNQEFCARVSASCGEVTAEDGCGNMRTIDCGGCDGLASCVDNSCECDIEAACAELRLECDSVDVAGTCANVQRINCGTCGSGATCEQNLCACEDGYTKMNAQNCADVDECSMGADDCDPNAECTNTPGSFECTCPPGWEGDGTTCTMPTLVAAVQTVEVALADDESSATATLEPAMDMAQTVLFATQRNNTVSRADEMTVHVTITADDTIEVTRDEPTGETTVVVNAVEFDPGMATVQTGAFSMGGMSETVSLDQTVDPSRAFLVFNYSSDSNGDQRDRFLVAGRLEDDGSAATFVREAAAGMVSGTYWVVEATDDQFAVQHYRESINDGEMGDDTTLDAAVDPDATLLLYSYATDHNNDGASQTHVRCELSDLITVICRRYGDTSSITELPFQVVSFAGDEAVQRGTETIAEDGAGVTVDLMPAVDPTRSMAFGGQLGIVGFTQLDTTDQFEASAGFFTQEIVDGGQSIDLARGEPTDPEASLAWQVIQW